MGIKTRFIVTFLSIFLASSFIIKAYDLQRNPVPISPGKDQGVAVVEERCPTFSWSGVERATAYRIAIFEAVTTDVYAYKDMEMMAPLVIDKEIQGQALSWTPSSDEGLNTGSVYIWYVRAVDMSGFGEWSTGKKFRIEDSPGLPGLIENLKKRFKEFGVEEGVVDEVFKGVESGEKEEVSSGEGKKTATGNTVSRTFGSEGDANDNVYYGFGTGASITSGSDNSFFGAWAGLSTNSGDDNAFFGCGAGMSNTWGFSNTFVGRSAGTDNTWGLMNVFIGGKAGYCNTTGSLNTFVGCEAGGSNMEGSENVYIGNQAGLWNSSGQGNIFIGKSAGTYEHGSNKLYIENSTTSSPLIYGEFNNNLVKINGNFRVTGYLSLNNGTNQINSSEINILDGKTLVTSGSIDNDKLVTKGYVDSSDDVGGGLTGDYMTNQYICKWDDVNSRLVNSLITDSGGNIGINGSLSLNNNTFSLDNGAHWINSSEINILDGKTLVTGGSTDNDKLVTKGYVDTYDDFGGGLTGAFMTDQKICKWDDGNTRLVDSLISESPGIVSINGIVGIGTLAPNYRMELQTTGVNAEFASTRTDGATCYISGGYLRGFFGTKTDHPLRFVANDTWRMELTTDNTLNMRSGAYCTSTGVWTNASSIAFKENIQTLTANEAVDTLNRLSPVKFNYKTDKSEKYVGFIAEHVPDLVATKDRKGLSPMDIAAVLAKVVQEQQKVVLEQQRLNQEQQEIIIELQKRIAQLENK